MTKDRLDMPLLHEVAHLGHAELLTPEPDKSLWFFTEVLGLTENGASGESVYLRTWDDYEHHSLKLTAAATSGVRRTGLRAASAEAGADAPSRRDRGRGPWHRLAGRRRRHRPFAPDWEPITWSEAEGARGQAWELDTIPSFHAHGTPQAEQAGA